MVDVAEVLYLAFISDPLGVGNVAPSLARQVWIDRNMMQLYEHKSLVIISDRGVDRFISDVNDGQEQDLIQLDVISEGDKILCNYTSDQDVFDAIVSLLSSTPWSEVDVSTARNVRAEMYDLLHIDINTITQGPATRTIVSKSNSSVVMVEVSDELDSYSSLVREMGY